MDFLPTLDFARQLDAQDPLARFRAQYHIPSHTDGSPAIYFCGNSLGLQPKKAQDAILQELEDWKNLGVEGHFKGKNPWVSYHEPFSAPLAKLVGAQPAEVVAMNNLTVNLHIMLATFYRPTTKRNKIITEGGVFPSDRYALVSQINWHGFSPEECLIEIFPREGEETLRTADILKTIEECGEELATVMMGGVNYYTGQFYDLKAITQKAHEVGAFAGFDLAHTIGNVPLQLHDWEVDFAMWCTYKYLNSGPGSVSGVYVHDKHGNNPATPRLAGWWGHNDKERFLMKPDFVPMQGAAGWQMSNAPVMNMAAHKAALALFEEAGIENLREKSKKLTGYLEFLIHQLNQEAGEVHIEVITPNNPNERGCQLSLVAKKNGKALFEEISRRGVIADWREPNVIRVAPVPMYNTLEEVFTFYRYLHTIIVE